MSHGCSFDYAHIGISICWRHLITLIIRQIRHFFGKHTVLLHTCAPCSGLPSYINTMEKRAWHCNFLGLDQGFWNQFDISFVFQGILRKFGGQSQFYVWTKFIYFDPRNIFYNAHKGLLKFLEFKEGHVYFFYSSRNEKLYSNFLSTRASPCA